MKQSKGDKTKLHLFNCAMELFREKGYENVLVNEIVKKAGTAKGTFYVHFSSKADIIKEMLCRYDDYYDEVANQIPKDMETDKKIEYIVKASCNFTQNIIGLDLIKVLYSNELLNNVEDEMLLDNNREIHRILFEIIQEGQRCEKYTREVDAEYIALLIVRAMRSSFFEWCIQNAKFDLSKECNYLISLICKGLKA